MTPNFGNISGPLRKADRDDLSVVCGHGDVLLAVGHVGHRRAARRTGKRDLGNHLARRFVERPEQMRRSARTSAAAGERPDRRRARSWSTAVRHRRCPGAHVAADDLADFLARAIAVRNHPCVLARVQIDRRDATVGRLEEWNALRAIQPAGEGRAAAHVAQVRRAAASGSFNFTTIGAVIDGM